MDRLKIEKTKALIITVIAALALIVALATQGWDMLWIPVVLGILSGYFWWKVDYVKKNPL